MRRKWKSGEGEEEEEETWPWKRKRVKTRRLGEFSFDDPPKLFPFESSRTRLIGEAVWEE